MAEYPPAYCGRLDQHDAHDWTRPALLMTPARTYCCKGAPVTEGGWLGGAA